MSKKANSTDNITTDEPARAAELSAAPKATYEVLVDRLKVGAVIAYRTGRVSLTKDQATALLENQPDCIRFLGI